MVVNVARVMTYNLTVNIWGLKPRPRTYQFKRLELLDR